MTGDDQPRPGIGTFQVIFLRSFQRNGNFPAGACPCPAGPRNCAQSCEGAASAAGTSPFGGAPAGGCALSCFASGSLFFDEGSAGAVAGEVFSPTVAD